jgi:putative transposase
MTKRIGLLMRHYQFRQRLSYKCKAKQIKYIEVNEYCTSKTCSICGEYKKDLGGKKVYECNNCNNKIDRDINGSRCIFLKNTL